MAGGKRISSGAGKFGHQLVTVLSQLVSDAAGDRRGRQVAQLGHAFVDGLEDEEGISVGQAREIVFVTKGRAPKRPRRRLPK